MKTSDFKTQTIVEARNFPCPQGHWVLGLDIGYSAVKGMAPNKIFCFPAYAQEIPPHREVLKAADDTDIRYRDDDGTWTVGALAYDELYAKTADDSEEELYGRKRYYSKMFKVISLTGIGIALLENAFGSPKGKKISIQGGLPPKYKADDELVRDVLSGFHKFEVKLGKGPWHKFEFSIYGNDIYFMAQPLGALISASIDKNGKQLSTAAQYFKQNVLIFDPGFGTLDEYTVIRGQVTGDGTYPELAMKEVFRRTCRDIKNQYNYEVTIPELQNCLEKGTVKVVNRKKMISKNYSINEILERNCIGVCHDAIEKMKSIHDYFSKYDCIIATGGTYDAWAEEFNKTFRDMEDLIIVPANINDTSLTNVFSIVRGYYFYLTNQLKPIIRD